MTDSNQGTPKDGDDSIGDADRQWLDGLAGRIPTNGATNASRDAALLRKHLLAKHTEELAADEARNAADPGEQERDWNRLQFAARKAGVLTSRKRGPLGWLQGDRPAADWGWRQLGGVAAVLALGIAIGIPMLSTEDSKYGEPTTTMGENEVQHIADAAPQARAESMAAQLQAAGMTTRIYQRKAVFFVDIEVLPERLENFQPALVAAGIKPKPGLIRVQIAKP